MSETVKSQFELLLIKFNTMIENQPPVSEVKDKLEKLSELAKKSAELNYRQTEAITARCANYINGTYGKNTKKELYNASSKS